MKRILILVIIAVTFCFYSACGNHSRNLVVNSSPLYSENDSAVTVSNKEQDNNAVETIKPLEMEDFSVSDGENIISLDFPYIDFSMDLIEKEVDSNYVGEIFSGEYAYKFFCHEYDDFDLYISNINYDIKGRDFNEYFISQITLKTPAFKTKRGVEIGASAEDLAAIYGLGEELIEDGKTIAVYALNDMKIEFTIGENQKIQDISLCVFSEDDISDSIAEDDISDLIIGVWKIQFAKEGIDGTEYPLQNLYGTGIQYGGTLTLDKDGFFTKLMGITDDISDNKGAFSLKGNVITFLFKDGSIEEAIYFPSSQEIEYHTRDIFDTLIYEYFVKTE